jgi:dynein heavy chain
MLQCELLTGGMTKILEASEKLNELEAKLEIQKTAVAEQTATCEKLLVQVEEGKCTLRF